MIAAKHLDNNSGIAAGRLIEIDMMPDFEGALSVYHNKRIKKAAKLKKINEMFYKKAEYVIREATNTELLSLGVTLLVKRVSTMDKLISEL